MFSMFLNFAFYGFHVTLKFEVVKLKNFDGHDDLDMVDVTL